MKKYCFGVDVGGTTVKIGLFDCEGNILEKWEIPTRTQDNGSHILPDIAKALSDKLAEKKIDKEELTGVGIAVPGPVDKDGTVYRAVNLNWDTFSVRDTLADLCGLPVRVGNDANVAALGEMWKGGGQGYHSLVLVTLGTGVGGGVIINGEILSGSTGAGGEIGHIHIQDNEEDACGCGNHGCLEQYASATGVVRVAKRTLEKTSEDTALRNHADLTAKDVFDEAKAGDKVALEVVDEVCGILGATLSNIACVVNPEVIVIGGGVSKAGDILTDAVKKHFAATSFHACANTKFVLAGLGNDAGMYGCVEMLLD